MLFLLLPLLLLAILVFLLFAAHRMRLAEEKAVTGVLRKSCEYDALILDAFPIRPVVFHAPNIWLRVRIFPENEPPRVIRFVYESTCLDWADLYAGNRIRIEVNPDRPDYVVIISSRQSVTT